MTQSAISREIKTLEEQLGQPLFRRVNRTLQLTPAGEGLYRIADETLTQLDAEVERITGASKVVAVTTTTGLASLWLAPRLQRFNRAHPGIDVRVVASNDKPNLERDQLDIAIRFVLVGTDVPDSEPVFDCKIYPACSPALANDKPRSGRLPTWRITSDSTTRVCATGGGCPYGTLVRQDEDPARETCEYAAISAIRPARVGGDRRQRCRNRCAAAHSPTFAPESLVRSIRDGGSGATRRFLHHPPPRCCWTRGGRGVRRLALGEVRRDAELAPASVSARADGARQRASHAAFQKDETLGKRFERSRPQRRAPRMACTAIKEADMNVRRMKTRHSRRLAPACCSSAPRPATLARHDA